MEKTIFTVAVPMENQEQCDRMKQVCADNDLPIWEHWVAFEFLKDKIENFCFNLFGKQFMIVSEVLENTIKVSESEFLSLLEEYKKQK